jgi:hypothetical protein
MNGRIKNQFTKLPLVSAAEGKSEKIAIDLVHVEVDTLFMLVFWARDYRIGVIISFDLEWRVFDEIF